MSHFLDHDLVSTSFDNDSTNNDKYELFRLQQQEEYRRQVYVQHRCNLQETWENLVKLRQLVQVFNSNIEKAAEGEVKEFDQVDKSCNPHHDSRFQYDMYMNGVKLKMKLKEDLKLALSQKEMSLQQMKLDLEYKSKQLYSLSQTSSLLQERSSFSDKINASNPVDVQQDTQPNVSAYLDLRQSILILSNQIKSASAEFHDMSVQFTKTEADITEALVNTPSLLTNNTTPTSLSSNITMDSESIWSALSTEGPASARNGNDSNKGFFKVEGGVTIVDVLSGRANLYRISGEKSSQFKSRLQKRLSHLRYLEQTLRVELESGAEMVRVARDQFKEAELRRLQFEVTMSKDSSSQAAASSSGDSSKSQALLTLQQQLSSPTTAFHIKQNYESLVCSSASFDNNINTTSSSSLQQMPNFSHIDLTKSLLSTLNGPAASSTPQCVDQRVEANTHTSTPPQSHTSHTQYAEDHTVFLLSSNKEDDHQCELLSNISLVSGSAVATITTAAAAAVTVARSLSTESASVSAPSSRDDSTKANAMKSQNFMRNQVLESIADRLNFDLYGKEKDLVTIANASHSKQQHQEQQLLLPSPSQSVPTLQQQLTPLTTRAAAVKEAGIQGSLSSSASPPSSDEPPTEPSPLTTATTTSANASAATSAAQDDLEVFLDSLSQGNLRPTAVRESLQLQLPLPPSLSRVKSTDCKLEISTNIQSHSHSHDDRKLCTTPNNKTKNYSGVNSPGNKAMAASSSPLASSSMTTTPTKRKPALPVFGGGCVGSAAVTNQRMYTQSSVKNIKQYWHDKPKKQGKSRVSNIYSQLSETTAAGDSAVQVTSSESSSSSHSARVVAAGYANKDSDTSTHILTLNGQPHQYELSDRKTLSPPSLLPQSLPLLQSPTTKSDTKRRVTSKIPRRSPTKTDDENENINSTNENTLLPQTKHYIDSATKKAMQTIQNSEASVFRHIPSFNYSNFRQDDQIITNECNADADLQDADKQTVADMINRLTLVADALEASHSRFHESSTSSSFTVDTVIPPSKASNMVPAIIRDGGYFITSRVEDDEIHIKNRGGPNKAKTSVASMSKPVASSAAASASITVMTDEHLLPCLNNQKVARNTPAAVSEREAAKVNKKASTVASSSKVNYDDEINMLTSELHKLGSSVGVPEHQRLLTEASPPRPSSRQYQHSTSAADIGTAVAVEADNQILDTTSLSTTTSNTTTTGEISSAKALVINQMTLKIELLERKLRKAELSYNEACHVEKVDEATGIAVNEYGECLGIIELTILKAANLPEMKRMSHSADPFVEVFFARSDAASSKHNQQQQTNNVDDDADYLNHFQRTSNTTKPPHVTVIEIAKSIQEEIQVARTCVQYKTLYPEWQEYLPISPVTCINNRVIHFRLKDSSKLGESSDNHIGEAYLPIEQLLDQQKHKVWCPVIPTAYHKDEGGTNSGKKKNYTKLNENCSIQVEVQLFYSKKALWQTQINMLTESIQTTQKQLVKILQQHLSTKTVAKEKNTSNVIKKNQLRYQPDEILNKSQQSLASLTLDKSTDSNCKKKRVTTSSIIGLREKRTVASYLNTARNVSSSPRKDANENSFSQPSNFPSYFLEEVTLSRLEARSPRAMMASNPASNKSSGYSIKNQIK